MVSKQFETTCLLFVLFFVGLGTFHVQAQAKIPKGSSYYKRIAQLEEQINKKPGDLKLHQEYIDSVKFNQSALDQKYEEWIQKFPAISEVPFAIARYYDQIESPKAKPYLLKTVSLNPKLAEAWHILSMDAERWGRFDESRTYLEKAIEVSPDNPDYHFYYAVSFATDNISKFYELGLKVSENFPKHNRGAQALYWMAFYATDSKTRIKYFDLLISKYPPLEYNWSESGLLEYYTDQITEDPKNAVLLAKKALGFKLNPESWEGRLRDAQLFATASDFLNAKKGQEALSALSEIDYKEWEGLYKTLMAMKAKAYFVQGMSNAAYQLMIQTYLKAPSSYINNQINDYGHLLGKDETKINADIWAQIDSVAPLADSFSLKKSIGSDTVSLKDYKGKVLLLTYWFPGCDPCRDEFPYFERMIKEVKSENLAYLALNIIRNQTPYILPFLEKTGYSFLSLDDGDRRRKRGNLDHKGFAPYNFLIDKKGRVVFSNFRVSQSNQDDIVTMVKFLLTQKLDGVD